MLKRQLDEQRDNDRLLDSTPVVVGFNGVGGSGGHFCAYVPQTYSRPVPPMKLTSFIQQLDGKLEKDSVQNGASNRDGRGSKRSGPSKAKLADEAGPSGVHDAAPAPKAAAPAPKAAAPKSAAPKAGAEPSRKRQTTADRQRQTETDRRQRQRTDDKRR